MVKKIKSNQCQGRWCQQHLFSIKPYFFTNTHRQSETLRLCPKLNKDKKIFEKAIPELNLDNKFYTPLFILDQDKKLYVDNDARTLQNFQNSVLLEQYQISSIMVPRISSGKHYCKVCKEDYIDYLQHINSIKHRNQVMKNPYSTIITQLSTSFQLTQHQQILQLPEKETINKMDSFIESQVESPNIEKETTIRGICTDKALPQNEI